MMKVLNCDFIKSNVIKNDVIKIEVIKKEVIKIDVIIIHYPLYFIKVMLVIHNTVMYLKQT